MYPSDNRYPDNMSNLESMGPPMYNSQMRPSSIDMNTNRPPYYDTPYYQKAPPNMQQNMQPPMYDYMSQPPMMPMNQGIDPRYSNWRQPSENKNSIMPTYYDRPPEPYMHPKSSISNSMPSSMPAMSYPDTYPPSHTLINETRPSQMNLLQRISYLIKPQLPQLQKIMLKAANSSLAYKKKQTSKRQRQRQRQRSYERQRPRERSRSHENKKHSSSSGGEWVCSKCSFLNFDWRDKCKKCNESKPSFPSNSSGSGGGRNFIPGPEDWKCSKCGNLNYARRNECNRCKLPKNSNK